MTTEFEAGDSKNGGPVDSALLVAVRTYLARGWRLIPAKRDKKPYLDDWQHQAFDDFEMAERWFGGPCPVEHVAINCTLSGLVVVDIDGSDGEASLQALEDEQGKLDCALVAKTPRGRHFYFLAPPGAQIPTRTGVRLGIDVRAGWIDADGAPQSSGYVIAPPAHGRYWVDDVDPTKVVLVPPPEWLLHVLEARPAREANSPQVASNGTVTHRATRSLSPLRWKDIHAALSRVESDDRDTWRNVGYAIHHETGGSEEGFAIWDAWAATTKSGNYSADDNRTLWAKARKELGDREPVTIATLFRLAIDNDWEGPHSGWDDVEPNKATCPADVLTRWEQEGPLLHLPTGIPTLDAQTGGGPTVPCRVYVLGAPDAGKTAWLVQLLDHYASQGLTVGLLAVDEEDGDVLARLLQRRGWLRRVCEERGKEDLLRMREQVGDMPIRFYDATWSIEAAGADLAAYAKERGTAAVLGVDSVQAARSATEGGKTSRYDEVTARVAAIRSVASEHRMTVVATSEMSRGSYRDPKNKINDMAAGKESGAIEYSARLLLSLRNIPEKPDLIELRIVKSKLGPSTRDDEQGIVLRMDRASQTLAEAFGVAIPTQGDRAAAGAEARDRQMLLDAALLAIVVANNPGLGARRVEELVGAATNGGLGSTRFGRARGKLGAALVERPGSRTALMLYLNGGALPEDVIAAVPIEVRTGVVAKRPPEGAEPSCPEAPRAAPSRPGAAQAPDLREVPPPPIGGRGTSSGAGRLFPLIDDELGGTSNSRVAPEDDGLPEKPGGPRPRRGSGRQP